ncbi:SRPBCC family protein [Microlunatus endophyticus]|nr:SRPBCC family protein [Microlunatus endophyticus]
MQGSVTLPMNADPNRIWELVSDPTRIGRYSPETFEGEWTNGASGPAIGARFRGHVRRNGRGPVYWTPCVVTACEPGRRFEFTVGRIDRPVMRWGYEITPTSQGADVREYFAAVPSRVLRLYWAVAGRARTRTNMRNMRSTLERIRDEVE